MQKQTAVTAHYKSMYTVTAVCRIVIAACALICFSSERSRSANVGLMLVQCSRHCGVPGVFANGDDALSPVDVITGCDDVLAALPYHWKYVW